MTPVVIIVDDDQAVCSSLKFSLELEGFSVRTYRSPREVLAADDLPEYGCLILDYRLPEMSGLQLLGRLREHKVMLPAVLITTQPSATVSENASRAGVVLVEKPLLGETLVECIRSTLKGHRDETSPGAS